MRALQIGCKADVCGVLDTIKDIQRYTTIYHDSEPTEYPLTKNDQNGDQNDQALTNLTVTDLLVVSCYIVLYRSVSYRKYINDQNDQNKIDKTPS